MKIFGTGLKGMVGSRITELLGKEHQFEISDVDITDRDAIIKKISESKASTILHLAAKIDVDSCEKDEEADREKYFIKNIPIYQYIYSKSGKSAWEVNVIGTKNVTDACRETNKKLIYISTDFVFDGANLPEGGYTEKSTPNPINWYAATKYEAEKIVRSSGLSCIIARIAYPYRADFKRGDFARKILSLLRAGERVVAVGDQIITPTFIDDIAKALDVLIKNNARGIYHLTGSQFVDPYGAAVNIAKTFDLDSSLILKTTLEEYFKNRAPRPFNLSMNNSKIQNLGVRMKGFSEGLAEIKRQSTSC
ncbi:NAD(P)-dependent oxidoreductase [Patescibacteria group bacterium]|nr:NAD(P)-dependent oxidoreductase [Patescibacteria group bacterium]MCL5010162.1 NAD(P)-dependent oxidoreductase [Patescibacteria group bacterium]